MSDVKSAFKALTPEQQAIVRDKRVAGERSPDDWLRLLGPVAEFDRQADAVREGGGGFWARRYARKHDVPERAALVRGPADADPARGPGSRAPARARDRPVRPAAAAASSSTRARPYKKGAYHKVVDTFYDDVWLEGPAHFADGADVHFTVTDHIRSSSKTKRSARGKTKRKTKNKKKSELTVTLSVPDAQLRAGGAAAGATSRRSRSSGARAARRSSSAARWSSPTPTRSRRSGCCSS